MFWTVNRSQATVEALALAGVLALLLRLESNMLLAGFAYLWISLFPGAYAAFRTRLPARLTSILPEALFAVALNLLLQGMALLILGENVLSQVWRSSMLAYAGSLFVLILVFVLLRAGMVLWHRWQQSRHRRMAFGIVHAQLLAILAITSVLALREGAITLFSSDLTATPTEQWLASLLTLLTPTLFSMVIVTPFAAFVLLLGGGIAYLISRPITSRIEELASVTAHLRTGDYSARVPVNGMDEIAQLQTGFNAMAATLEETMNALKTERDTVENLLQSRQEWLATISHELRTPVATIRSYLETSASDDPQQQRDVMLREVLRLQSMLDDLFALARSDSGYLAIKCVETNIGPMIDHIVQTFAGVARQKAAISVVNTSHTDAIMAMVDPARLEQVLYNLLHNSLRHTPPGGIIALSAQQKDGEVHITVEDTGAGIPADVLAHIWERFYSRDDRIENAGIGLALVKELVLGMGGQVHVSSVPGQGTRFTICLPRIHAID